LKVLIIQGSGSNDLISGEDVVIANDVKELHSNGINVVFKKITLCDKGIKKFLQKIAGVTWSISKYKIVDKYIQEYKPDLIHFHTILPYLSLSVIYAAKKNNLPILQTLHNGRWLCLEGGYFRAGSYCDDCIQTYGFKGVLRGCGHGPLISFLLFLNNFLFRRFDKSISKFIAVSNFVKDQHIRSNFPLEKVIVRKNSVPDFKEKISARRIKNQKNITYSGRISIAKGSNTLELLIQNLDVCINIIGNGPELENITDKYQHYPNVYLYGKVSNEKAIQIIEKSSVVVIPSKCGESYPTVAIEALSRGIPIVASNIGGLKEIVEESSAGLLVDLEKEKEFVETVEMLINNPEKLEFLRSNAIKFSNKNNIKSKTIELINIYKSEVF